MHACECDTHIQACSYRSLLLQACQYRILTSINNHVGVNSVSSMLDVCLYTSMYKLNKLDQAG